jgi:hypothetical protein
MKVNFEYNGEVYRLKVPKRLVYMFDLIESLAENEEYEADIRYNTAYDYLDTALCIIFEKSVELRADVIYADFKVTTSVDTCSLRVNITDV